jgi:hypothetical protein
MIRNSTLLLTVSLGLIMSALLFSLNAEAQTTQVHRTTTKITALPFNIVTPGTYRLTGDLSFPSVIGTPAISVLGGLPGPVVVDLNGFAIGGDVTPGSFCIVIGSSPVSSPITITNGTIRNFVYGVYANNLSSLTINKVNFLINILRPFAPSSPTGICFQNVNSSAVSNSVFTNEIVGVQDTNSGGGNRYLNDSFVFNVTPLEVSLNDLQKPSVLIKNYEFAAP